MTIINKVSRSAGILPLAKRYLPLETVQMLYRSLIEQYFRYCCPIWGSASSANLKRLEKLQNRAASIVTDSPYDAHSEPLIKKLVWLTIKQLIDTETVKIVYKALHNEAPKYLKELFHRLSDIQNRELRNTKTDLHIPLLSTSLGQKALHTGEYAFGTTLHVKQKQVDRSPPSKQKLKG